MKSYIKTFEQFIFEAENPVKAPDSKTYVEDVTIESGEVIKAVEILGAITASETEEQFKDYFFQTYGQNDFTPEDMSQLVTYFNKYQEEKNQEETDKEQKEKESEDDGLGDIGGGDLGADISKL
jgi:hypothetical protein